MESQNPDVENRPNENIKPEERPQKKKNEI